MMLLSPVPGAIILLVGGSLLAQCLDPTLPAANTSSSWTNSADDQIRYGDGSIVRVVLLLSHSHGASSDDVAFACGFFCGAPCDRKSFLFGVFLVGTNDSTGGVAAAAAAPPPAVMVWSANRDRPVGDNATLQLSDAGDLVLRDAGGAFVWSTNTSAGHAVAGVRLSDSGNLVLFDDSGSPVWQSFDHPADVLLPGQYLRPGMRLTANFSAANFSEGSLYVTARNNAMAGFVGHDPPQLYFTAPVSDTMDDTLANITFLNGSISAFGRSPSSSSEILIPLPVAHSVQYIRVESDGHMRLYGWNSSSWVIMYEVLQKYIAGGDCEYPMACGSYGICSGAGNCSCPSEIHSSPIYRDRPGLGCKLATPISCRNVRGIEMVELPNVTYFNYNGSGAIIRDKVTRSDCLSGCVANCSCKAAYFKLRMNDTNGTCFLQSQLFSLHKLQTTAPSLYNSRAFIKLNNITFAERVRPMKKTFGTGILVGIIIGTVSLLFSIALLIRMRTRRERVDGEHIEHLPGMPRKFSFEELKVVTGDFSSKIGEGASGTVFEGKIEDENIAVKRLDSVGRRKEEFLTEVQTIGSIHHVNLVRMIGFCAEKNHRLLVYEYMPNGSLDRWIFDGKDGRPLDWPTRHKIVSDIARGLCYLHEGCRQRIVHLDIKPQNILLDDQFNAKISDFGVAKLVDKDKSRVMTRMRGTPGYLAPEWLTSTITEKADVYSFGVVVLEIICGRRNLDHSQPEEALHLMSLLQESARNDKLLDMIDHRMDDMQLHSEDVMHMMHLAMWCLQLHSNRRPSMSTVLRVLEDAATMQEDIDFNFVVTNSSIFNEGIMGESNLPSASLLSGPR